VNPEDFLKSLVDYEKQPAYDYNLNEFVRFLEQLDSPQDKLHNIIHFAGTKGKGSCVAILASCLVQSGYKVGQYTSPHLASLRERIKINDQMITNKELAFYIDKIKDLVLHKPMSQRRSYRRAIIKKKRSKGVRTFFETLTAIAFLHFLRRKTDFVILEVGLGGRLDATNSVNPLISVMTRIGYDHTALLGNTLAQIAREKAGIIKYQGRLITIKQRPSVQKIISEQCRLKFCTLQFAENQHSIKVLKQTINGSNLRITGQLGTFKAFLPLPGHHQVENLLLVLAVISQLRSMGFKIPLYALQKGIRQTQLRGRFDIISPKKPACKERAKKPVIIFDAAHNRDSFEALYKNIRTINIRNFYLIFGSSLGKDISYAIRHIFPIAKGVVLVRADSSRALGQEDIYKKAKKHEHNMTIACSVLQAIDYITTISKKNDIIIITGSFYLWQPNW
jgi:dihydrofolate synthase/folylpolyglutamate synthase